MHRPSGPGAHVDVDVAAAVEHYHLHEFVAHYVNVDLHDDDVELDDPGNHLYDRADLHLDHILNEHDRARARPGVLGDVRDGG